MVSWENRTLTKGGAEMYKNWKAICQIPDNFVMLALALLDLTTDFGRKIAERFPEYFSDELRAGPIPLSVLQITAEENAVKQQDPGNGANHLVLYDAIPEWMPLFWFATDKDALKHGNGVMVLPADLDNALEESNEEVGKIYKWKDKEVVLVDFIDTGEWYFVPAELIIIDK